MKQLLVLAALAAANQSAPACGFYAPRVFMVSEHFKAGQFALVDHRDVPADGWQLLDPHSYDSTLTADAPAGSPLKLTLLGAGGMREVTATKRVFLKGGWDEAAAMGAYALDTGGKHFSIAVAGSHSQLSFTSMDNERVGNIATTTIFADGAYETKVVRGEQDLGTFDGKPLGRLDADGMQYLLIDHAGDVRAIYI